MSPFEFRRLKPFQTSRQGDIIHLEMPLPKSPMGKIQRYCPNGTCVPRRFQLGQAPDDRKIPNEVQTLTRRSSGRGGTTCPYCGIDSADDQFHAPEDIKAAQEYVKWAAAEEIGEWVAGLADNFNRSMRSNNPLGVSMSVKRSPKPPPRTWREDLLRDLTCDICGRNYGVYAIALFCPDCGARNLHVHFRRERELVQRQLEIADSIGKAGETELAYRLLANAHEDVLTAFETYQKAIFKFLVSKLVAQSSMDHLFDQAKGNPFQNVDRARDLFQQLGLDPYEALTEDQAQHLGLCIQKRHVIGHNLGLADDKFLESSSEAGEGESVRLVAQEIASFADTCLIVIARLEEAPEFLPP